MRIFTRTGLAAFVLFVLSVGLAQGATPANGSVSEGSPMTTYQGGPFNDTNPGTCPSGVDAPGCDRYHLTVTPATTLFEVGISIVPSSAGDDYDMFVYDSDGNEVGSSATGGGSETVTLDNPGSDIYEIIVQAFTVVPGGTYDATIELSLQSGDIPDKSPEWTITSHGACCESNLASEGGTTYVLAPILVNGNDILRSNDGGKNWTKVYPPVDVSVPYGIEGDLQAINDDVIYFGTELAAGIVATSRDRGETWLPIQLPVPFAANDQSWSYIGPMTDVPGCNGLQSADYVLAGWFRIGSVAVFSCDGGTTWPIQTPLVGNNGSGPVHIVCQNEAVAPVNGGDTRIANPEFVRMKAGRHGNFGPDKNFYWSEVDTSSLYVCKTEDFGINWTGTQHPLPAGTPSGLTVSMLAFDDNGTQYVMHGNKLNVSFDSGTSFTYTHVLPRWGSANTGDGGSAEYYVVENGNMHLAISTPGPGAGNTVYYLYGQNVDTATPTWTEEVVDVVPSDAGSTVRLDFMQLTVDDNGIPTLGYTTPAGGTTTASRLTAPALDPDGDGVSTIDDNCPLIANADQANSDTDSFGDLCDNCTLIANESQCNTNHGVGAEKDLFGNHCDADLDNNGIVNSFDLTIMRNSFGATGQQHADLNCNEVVNSFDLSIMRGNFGGAPGPTGLVAP